MRWTLRGATSIKCHHHAAVVWLERGLSAAVEERGVHPAEHAQRRVPDRVDAGMDQVQPPSCAPPWDRAASHPAALELLPADHPMLARGHTRDPLSGLLPPNCVAGLTGPVSKATWFGHVARLASRT